MRNTKHYAILSYRPNPKLDFWLKTGETEASVGHQQNYNFRLPTRKVRSNNNAVMKPNLYIKYLLKITNRVYVPIYRQSIFNVDMTRYL